MSFQKDPIEVGKVLTGPSNFRGERKTERSNGRYDSSTLTILTQNLAKLEVTGIHP